MLLALGILVILGAIAAILFIWSRKEMKSPITLYQASEAQQDLIDATVNSLRALRSHAEGIDMKLVEAKLTYEFSDGTRAEVYHTGDPYYFSCTIR